MFLTQDMSCQAGNGVCLWSVAFFHASLFSRNRERYNKMGEAGTGVEVSCLHSVRKPAPRVSLSVSTLRAKIAAMFNGPLFGFALHVP